MNSKTGVGERLKWLREHLGMSGTVFGLRIGLPQTKIADLEREKTKISLGIMEALERELDVSKVWLMEGVGAWKKTEAVKALEGNLNAIQGATQAAITLGLSDEDGRRLQELIVGLKMGDKAMVERALNAHHPRQRALLDNYDHADDAGKKIIEGTASLAAQSVKKGKAA